MIQYNPKTITDGLIFYFDAGNSKSYPASKLPIKKNCILWLDASDLTSINFKTGSSIQMWADKSGKENHAIQTNASDSYYPTYRSNSLNGLPGISFANANAQSFDLTSLISTSEFTFVGVISASITFAHILADSASVNGNSRIAFNSGPVITNANGTQLASGTLNYPEAIYSATYTSGSLIAYNTGSSTSTLTTPTGQVYFNVVGKQRTTATALLNMNGDMNEIILYDRVLSPLELNKVHTYLGQKWGITNSDRKWFNLTNDATASFAASGTGTNIGNILYNESPPYFRLPNVTSGSLLRYDFRVNSSEISINAGTIETLARFAYSTASTNCFIFNSVGAGSNRFYIRGNIVAGPLYLVDVFRGTVLADNIVLSSNIGLNTWFHASLSWNETTMYGYLNGNLIGSKPYTNGVSNPTTFTIGGSGGVEQCFPGDISFCKIYNKMLSSDEILKNYINLKNRYNL